jgi:hypothetical protein
MEPAPPAQRVAIKDSKRKSKERAENARSIFLLPS